MLKLIATCYQDVEHASATVLSAVEHERHSTCALGLLAPLLRYGQLAACTGGQLTIRRPYAWLVLPWLGNCGRMGTGYTLLYIHNCIYIIYVYNIIEIPIYVICVWYL